MRRMAIFVEGYTEVSFTERLIRELAGKRNIAVEAVRISGGSQAPKQYVQLHATGVSPDNSHYFLIYDCRGETQVAARIRQEHESLTKKGYQSILGLRDVRPSYTREKIPELQRMVQFGQRTKLAPLEILFSIMEVEAWFLAEDTHFSRIDQSLNPQRIAAELGFTPGRDDMTERDHPAKDLDDCYRLVGQEYKKGGKLTIPLLDMDYFYAEVKPKIPQLNRFVEVIEEFFQ